MKTTIFPGNFDLVTLGHLDIIEHVNKLFDRLTVIILENSEKRTTFSVGECLTFLRSNTAHLPNVEVAADHGLMVGFAREQEAVAIVHGARSVKSYEYELDTASVSQHIAPKMEAVLLYTSPGFSYVSSSTMRELVKYGQDTSAYVPKDVMEVFINRQKAGKGKAADECIIPNA